MAAIERTINERLLETWVSEHLSEPWLGLFADDVFYEDVTMGVQAHGKDQLRAFADSVKASSPDFTVTLVSRFAAESTGCIEWLLSGTNVKAGKGYQVRGVSVVDFADGKIQRCRDYWDGATVARQLGSLPPRAQT